MYDLDQFPKVVVSGKEFALGTSAGSALGNAVTGGSASIGAVLSKQVEITSHTPEGLIQFLHMRTATTRRAHERSKSLLGRIINRFTGEHPVYVKLSGHHLTQVLMGNDALPENVTIPRSAQCGLRLDLSEEFLKGLWAKYRARQNSP